MTYSEACRALCVAEGAPRLVGEAAYRVLSKETHPDVGGSLTVMTRLNAAIEVIRTTPPRPPARPPVCSFARPTDKRMPWGKHRGMPMADVPLGYLGFLADEADSLPVRLAAQDWLHYRVSMMTS